MSATDSALLLRAIEQSGNQTLEALERTQVAQRDGFRAMADAVRDLGATLQRQIEQQAKIESARATTAAPRETNWSLLIGLGGLLVAMIVPLYAWQGETARHTQEMADQLGDRMELMRENVVKNAAQLGALVRDHREVETQFDAQWMAMDIELQHQDRINGLLWNAQPENKDNPWIARDYWPSMRRKEIGQ